MSAGQTKMSAGQRSDSGQWTVDSGEGYKSSRAIGQTSGPKSDDLVPSSPAEWLEFFSNEHGVDIDHRSIHDRKKFWSLATAWAKSNVTVGQMRTAIAKAQGEAKEPISFLPAYVDRVLVSQTTKQRPQQQSRHHGISDTDVCEGVSADGRF
jgi:hypothetical protein